MEFKSSYARIAILNNNPSLAADCVLAAGSLSVLDTANTGAPWGESVPYSSIIAGSVLGGSTTLYLPYALGVFGVKKFITNAVTPVVGDVWRVIVTEIIGNGENRTPYQFQFIYVVQTAVIATEITAFAAAITANGAGLVTATNSGNDLEITGNFGDVNLGVNDFAMNFYGLNVTQSITTAVVQPVGTPAQALEYFPASLVTASSYNVYGFDFIATDPADESLKQNEAPVLSALVFVDATADSGGGTFNATWVTDLGGSATASLYLGR